MTRIQKNMLWVLGTFLALWLAAVTWEIHSLLNADQVIARFLNALAAESETLSLSCILLERNPGLYATIAIFIVLVFILSAAKPRQAPGNIPLYFAYTGILMLVGWLMVEALDHYVRRPSPASVLQGFVVLEDMMGVRFGVDKETKFPDIELSVTAILFYLAFFRFGSRALPFLGWLLILSAATIASGNTWPSDALGAFLFGWIFVCLIYISGINAAYQRFERQSQGWNASFARRVSDWVRTRPWSKRDSDEEDGLLPSGKATDGMKIGHVEQSLISSHYGFEDIVLRGTPHKGKLFPIIADGTPYAFKKTRIAADGVGKLTELLEVVHGLEQLEAVRFPRILKTRGLDLAFTANGHSYYMMEWMAGSKMSFSRPAHAMAVVQTLAHFHAATRIQDSGAEAAEELGTLVGGFRRYTEQAAGIKSGWWQALVPQNAEQAERDQAFQRTMHEAEIIARAVRVYTLEDKPDLSLSWIHRDIHPMNFLIDSEGHAVLLDFDRMRPGLGVLDLAVAMHRASRALLWKTDTLRDLLHAYTSIHPLSRSELTFLLAYLLLPSTSLKPDADPSHIASKLAQARNRRRYSQLPMVNQIDSQAKEAFLSDYCQEHHLELPLLLLDRELERPAPAAAPSQRNG